MMNTAAASALPVPPDVEPRPHTVTTPFGAQRQDEYYWLRDDSREDPAVLAAQLLTEAGVVGELRTRGPDR